MKRKYRYHHPREIEEIEAGLTRDAETHERATAGFNSVPKDKRYKFRLQRRYLWPLPNQVVLAYLEGNSDCYLRFAERRVGLWMWCVEDDRYYGADEEPRWLKRDEDPRSFVPEEFWPWLDAQEASIK